MEYFCVDPGCDCRQVYLYILNDGSQAVEAVISFGWEPLPFYTAWNRGLLDDMLRDFKGPALAYTMHPQGIHAKLWLNYVKRWLKADKPDVKRLEKHYRMMEG